MDNSHNLWKNKRNAFKETNMTNNSLSEKTKDLEKEADRTRDYDRTTFQKTKTTLLIDSTLKKLAQVYAIQNDSTLQEVVEEGLRKILLDK